MVFVEIDLIPASRIVIDHASWRKSLNLLIITNTLPDYPSLFDEWETNWRGGGGRNFHMHSFLKKHTSAGKTRQISLPETNVLSGWSVFFVVASE